MVLAGLLQICSHWAGNTDSVSICADLGSSYKSTVYSVLGVKKEAYVFHPLILSS